MQENTTPNFGIPLPDPQSQLQHDVLRLIEALQKIDSELQKLLTGKASNTAVQELSNAQQSIAQELGQAKTAINQELETKQARLVSGTNIKTIGGESVLGEGDIANGLVVANITSNTIAQAGHYYCITTEGVVLTMPENPELGDEIGFCNTSSGDAFVNWNGGTVKGVEPIPKAMVLPRYGAAVVKDNGSTWA